MESPGEESSFSRGRDRGLRGTRRCMFSLWGEGHVLILANGSPPHLPVGAKILDRRLQSILISHGFHTREFAYLLKFICKPRISTYKCFRSFPNTCNENFELLYVRVPKEAERGNALPSCLSSHTVNKCPYVVYLMPHSVHF